MDGPPQQRDPRRVAGAVLVLLVGGAIAVVSLRQLRLARGHRDVAGLAVGAVVTGVILFVTVTAILAPDVWGGLFRFVTDLYEGGS